jgi:hypothetical protein
VFGIPGSISGRDMKTNHYHRATCRRETDIFLENPTQGTNYFGENTGPTQYHDSLRLLLLRVFGAFCD